MPHERLRQGETERGRDGYDTAALSLEEQRALHEIAVAIKTIGYGSIVLTIHDGRLVEFTKTVRSRIQSNKGNL
jgi:hypothetical protein